MVDFDLSADQAMLSSYELGAVAIVVGGTHYYLEALLWDNVLAHALDAPMIPKEDSVRELQNDEDENTDEKEVINTDTTEQQSRVAELYARLVEVDPLMASWLHPHNERKIRRALEVYSSWKGKEWRHS